jgi:hypothetical protein
MEVGLDSLTIPLDMVVDDMMHHLGLLYNQLCMMGHLGFWYNQVYTMDYRDLLYNLLVV